VLAGSEFCNLAKWEKAEELEELRKTVCSVLF